MAYLKPLAQAAPRRARPQLSVGETNASEVEKSVKWPKWTADRFREIAKSLSEPPATHIERRSRGLLAEFN